MLTNHPTYVRPRSHGGGVGSGVGQCQGYSMVKIYL